MEEGTLEKEPVPLVVRLGELFYPFAEGPFKFSYPPETHPIRNALFPSITLPFEFLGQQIPVRIYLEPGDRPRSDAIQPFAPQEGYVINGEDFVREQRVVKLAKAINTPITLKEPGGCLRVVIQGKDLKNLGLAKRNPDRWRIFPYIFDDRETETLFYSLCCGIEVNGLRFEAGVNQTSHDADLWFYLFHPADTPPLPPTEWKMEGNNILLPCDLQKLSQLEMVFTRREKSSEDIETEF